jgi:hypothetical protein
VPTKGKLRSFPVTRGLRPRCGTDVGRLLCVRPVEIIESPTWSFLLNRPEASTRTPSSILVELLVVDAVGCLAWCGSIVKRPGLPRAGKSTNPEAIIRPATRARRSEPSRATFWMTTAATEWPFTMRYQTGLGVHRCGFPVQIGISEPGMSHGFTECSGTSGFSGGGEDGLQLAASEMPDEFSSGRSASRS